MNLRRTGNGAPGRVGLRRLRSFNFAEIAAAEQDGHAQLWALDTKRQLWATWQETQGGTWMPWPGPNFQGAPLLDNITACQQGGTRGTQIWGITEDYTLISNEITPGGANTGADPFGILQSR